MPKPKRGATDLNGVLAVDKPAGLTSHDVVDRIRRISGEGRVGHAGTLDPMATGLLLVCIGPACKRSDELMGGSKAYVARIVFGAATETDDAEGAIIAEAPVPACLADERFAHALLARFEGEQQQLPPCVSAIKKDGVAAYRRVRQGEEPVRELRQVVIHTLKLLACDEHWWDVAAEVSKGTYIRSLARDLGEAAGTRAHLGRLRRTRTGTWTLADAYTLEELESTDDIRDLLR